MKNLKIRLVVFSFLEFAVWGSYLTSIGNYLASVGLGKQIFWFFTIQGIVSLFMPILVSHIADKLGKGKTVLGVCHLLAALFKTGAFVYCLTAPKVDFWPLFVLFGISVAFYIPTIGLGNALTFRLLLQSGHDTVKSFPPIRVFGTVGFIVAMLIVNFVSIGGLRLQASPWQLALSALFSLLTALSLSFLPKVKKQNVSHTAKTEKLAAILKAPGIIKFLIFSFLIGVCLQITNSYGNVFISSFNSLKEFAGTWGSENANAIIAVSQVSETLCILLIPFAMRWFGIKKVIIISAVAWALRFALLGIGDTGSGLVYIILSMIIYGIAFDFLNIAGAIYLDSRVGQGSKNRIQGLFMFVTSGLGATIGTPLAGSVVNHFVYNAPGGGSLEGWQVSWLIFAGYSLLIALAIWVSGRFPSENSDKLAG